MLHLFATQWFFAADTFRITSLCRVSFHAIALCACVCVCVCLLCCVVLCVCVCVTSFCRVSFRTIAELSFSRRII